MKKHKEELKAVLRFLSNNSGYETYLTPEGVAYLRGASESKLHLIDNEEYLEDGRIRNKLYREKDELKEVVEQLKMELRCLRKKHWWNK